jgi:hypothetical protein
MKMILTALLACSSLAAASVLPVPQGFAAKFEDGVLVSTWQSVQGATAYRVAFFDEPGADGKRPLLAAVWVKGTRYVYGATPTLPKLGALKSTAAAALPAGARLRAMVAAAKDGGADKSDWAGLEIDPAPAADTATPTTSPTPAFNTTATATPTPEPVGGEEFKQSPDAAVLDVDEGTETAAAAAGAVPTLGEAKGLLASGKLDEAEVAYRALTEKDAADADAWEGLGDVYAGRKMKIEAVEAYEKALSLNKSKSYLNDWIRKNVRR